LRVVDLSVAALIGFASVGAIAVWNPVQLSVQAQAYSEQASLTDYLMHVVSGLGLPWLQQASPNAICSSLLSYSNSSLQVSAEGRDFVCSTGPPAGVQSASIVLQFPRGNLSLLAWRQGKQ